jgi:hypothetical protein
MHICGIIFATNYVIDFFCEKSVCWFSFFLMKIKADIPSFSKRI